MGNSIAVFWFRRDLRLEDNTGLSEALQSGLPVLPVFIFDKEILDELEDKDDKRVDFIHRELTKMNEQLKEWGSGLWVRYGKPDEIWKDLLGEFEVEKVFTNHDYEPYAKSRDEEIGKMLEGKDASFHTFKDQVIRERDEVLTQKDTPYTVFTPYSKTWKDALTKKDLEVRHVKKYSDAFLEWKGEDLPTLESMGFEKTDADFPTRDLDEDIVSDYDENRDYPAMDATTRMSVHLRFGTVSIRSLVRRAKDLNEVWLNELIWREFYMQILDHFPHVVNAPFREKYEGIQWRNNEDEFKKWCDGKTGYPLVDAGMRQLRQTGFMHNRVRMVVASFLTKHLLIDWRWGEGWFARWLLDYELASNNGGWQWAAGTGTDAAPYFRIFNPESQIKKYDSDKEYIKEWVPEFGTDDYPDRMVEHKMARERCLSAYKEALDKYDK